MSHPNYASMKFPDYEYRAYPKWVKDLDGNDVLVTSEAAHQALEAERAKLPVEIKLKPKGE